MSVRLSAIGLLLSLLLAAPVVATDDGKEHQPKSGAYSIRVPEDWQAGAAPDRPESGDGMKFVRPGVPQLVVVVYVMKQKAPFKTLVEATRRTIEQKGAELENDTDLKVGERDAWSYEVVVTAADGSKNRVRQTIVDGPRCAMVIAVSPEPWGASDGEEVNGITSTFRMLLEDPSAAPFEFEARDFLEGALHLEVPKGGAISRESSDGFEFAWPERGLRLIASWDRTRLSPQDFALYDLDRSGSQSEGMNIEPIEQCKMGGSGDGFLQRAYLVMKDTRIATVILLTRSSGEGEVAGIGFGRVGEVPFDEMKQLEEKLLGSELKPHFVPPASELPPLSKRVGEAPGACSFVLPDGWVEGKAVELEADPGAPKVAEIRKWGAERAMDLGVSVAVGSIPGGKDAYLSWWRKSGFRQAEKADLAEPRAVQVGGRDALVCEAEFGADGDRKSRCTVLVFDRDGFVRISSSCPISAKGAYGGLAERVAATIEWAR